MDPLTSAALGACGLVLLKSYHNLYKAGQHADAAKASAERSQRSAISARSHSLTALAHAKTAQGAEKKASESGTLLATLMLTSAGPATTLLRTREQAHEETTALNEAREDKAAITAHNERARVPNWLDNWNTAADSRTIGSPVDSRS